MDIQKKQKTMNNDKMCRYSKKHKLWGLFGITLAMSGFLFSGCCEDGVDGKNGTQWFTNVNEISNAVEGDFYQDIDGKTLYRKTGNEWVVVVNHFGEKGETGASGATWLTGTSISGTAESISATITGAKKGDLYYNTSTYDVYECTREGTWKWLNNIRGTKGDIGEQGEKGADGNGIASITKTGPGEDGLTYTYTIKFTDTNKEDFVFSVKNGATGETGNGISGIEVDSAKTDDTKTTYKINFTDGTTFSFTVKNGQDGEKGEQGVSITKVERTEQGADGTDTYTITYSDNTTSTFTVTNGKDGADADNIEMRVDNGKIQWRYKTGADLEWKDLIEVSTLKGTDGYIPYIQDGYWYINNVNQNIPATGENGKEIEVQVSTTAIQWRYVGDASWTDLVQLSTLKGASGTDGKSVKIALNDGNIQWRYIDDSNEWQTIITTESLKGAKGTDGTTPHIGDNGNWFIGETDTNYKAAGTNGKEIQLQVSAGYIQWQYVGDESWTNLIEVSTLKGTDGATWFTGTKVTSENLTANITDAKTGDLYLNTNTYDIFKNNNGTWEKIGNIKGANGQNGTSGATWLTGDSDPTEATQGNENDLYLNTTTGDIFKKTSSGWGENIGNIKGEKGDTGATGTSGATWLTGTSISGTAESISATITGAKKGDLYYNTSTCDVYECTGEDTWKWLSNIRGAKGDTGEQGDKGEQGTSWRFGNGVPGASLGNNGDLYLNISNWYVYTKVNGNWNYTGCLKGEKGDRGNDGASTADALVYTGFDGYVWQGATRTTIQAAQTGTVDENIRENTLSITETMKLYYPGSYIDLSSYQIAIMSSYFPNIGKTQYSGTTISSITIYAEKEGELYIGTASVADVINAKKNSLSSITCSTTAYTVVAGKNEIILNLKVGENETLVIGGNSSVGIYYATGIPVPETLGGYAYINGEYNADIIQTTKGYNDTLAIEIKVGAWSEFAEVALYSDIKDALVGKKSGFNITLTPSEKYGIVITACDDGETPAPAYQGKTITKIGFILSDYLTTETNGRTEVTDDDAIMYAYKVKSSLIAGNGSIADNYIEKYRLTFKNYKKNTSTENLKDLVTIDSNPWSYTTSMELYDSTTNKYSAIKGIEIGSDELIAFVVGNCDIILVTNTSAATDVYSNAYTYQGTKGYYHYYECTEDKVTWYWKACNPCALPLDIYYKGDGATVSFEENYAKLEAEEAEAIELNKAKQIKEAHTNNKTISFLGDSLTAYKGISNNATDYNSTLSTNANSYGEGLLTTSGITSADQTWWKQSADDMGMTVLVNNSCSGSLVSKDITENNANISSGINRCEQLHDDTGDNAGTNPDIIAVYMGINDMLDDSVAVDTFKTSYTSMIEKIIAKYTNAEIVVFTLPYIKLINGKTTGFVDVERLTAFNTAIKEVGEANECLVVEVYPNYSWAEDNWTEYCITAVNDGLGHPNAKGMDLLTDAFIDAMYNEYVVKNAS